MVVIVIAAVVVIVIVVDAVVIVVLVAVVVVVVAWVCSILVTHHTTAATSTASSTTSSVDSRIMLPPLVWLWIVRLYGRLCVVFVCIRYTEPLSWVVCCVRAWWVSVHYISAQHGSIVTKESLCLHVINLNKNI